jgi:hypothetical protein
MSDETEFEQFVECFHQDVIVQSQDTDNESFKEEQFTELMLLYLADISEVDNFEICSHQGRGIKVNAYNFSNESDSQEGIFLDLFVSLYSGDVPPQTISKTDLQTQFKRLKTFFNNAITHNYTNLEESSPAFDLADRIHQLKDNILRVRLFVLTDGIANVDAIENETLESAIISYHVWDMPRLFRLISSGNRPEPIEIDFKNKYGQSVPCLPMPTENSRYTTYLAILPGKILSEMYSEFGPKLLERNVRAFLQMKGKVNRGIRDTIKTEPDMFLAYNNGISATAQEIEIEGKDMEIPRIVSIRDFQIVNGGQTTAGIHYTCVKEKWDLSSVFVQVKLTVLKNQDDVDKIVPKISEYANSQNKINAADFTSNDPFHIELEKISRRIWAPTIGGSQIETHWYYERTRGQYQVDKTREKTPKNIRIFTERNPTNQRFAKTDLAKYENSWDQLPYIVSLGAEKNFHEYVQLHEEIETSKPNDRFFTLLIAKAILFKRIDKIVQSQKFGGYKANIVTYSVALLSKLTDKKIDLERIWKDQSISPVLEEFISTLTPVVKEIITNPPGGKNITEWCKKKECWEMFQNVKFDLPEPVKAELVNDTTLLIPIMQNSHPVRKTWTLEEVPVNTSINSIEDLFESDESPENNLSASGKYEKYIENLRKNRIAKINPYSSKVHSQDKTQTP